MSNLIRYIIQEDPEKQMKKNDLDYTKYSTSWAPVQKQSQEDKYKGYKFSSKNLLENSFNSLTSNKSSQSKDEGSLMSGISNIFNNIKSDAKSSSNTSLPQSIAKTAAEESSKIGTVLSPKPIGNDAASYKVAQNNKWNIANDAKTNNINYSLYGNGFSKEFIDEMVNDKEFNQILNEYIIPNEGGLSDKPNDRGKLTKFGISKNTYPNEDILNLTRERANAIIYRDFYKWNGLNKLPYPIRGFVVDYGMPSSPLNAIKTVHKVLGLPSNGNIIGPATMEKLKNFSQQDYEKFLEQYKQSMLEYYNNIVKNDSTQKGNLEGWLNRANRAHLGK